MPVLLDVDASRDERDRDPRTAQPREQVVRPLTPQVHVEQDHVRALGADGRFHFGDGCSLSHRESLELEIHATEQAQCSVVIDDEDPGHPRESLDDYDQEVAPRTGSDERYALLVGRLWSGLSPTLTGLDELPADIQALRRLQYALHVASENAYGLRPPAGAASAHAELADALVCAREATAEMADACELWGADGAQPYLYEWRGALFRVRLARMRLAGPAPRPREEPEPDGGTGRAALAVLLALAGALAFVAGATLGLWPVWAAGIAAVCVSVLAYRP